MRAAPSTWNQLDEAGVDTLLHLVLRGPGRRRARSPRSGRRPAAGTRSFVRELVLGALQGGQHADQHGVWRLHRAAGHLARGCSNWWKYMCTYWWAEAREALDVLTVWEPTESVDVGIGRHDPGLLETLEPVRAARIRDRRASPPGVARASVVRRECCAHACPRSRAGACCLAHADRDRSDTAPAAGRTRSESRRRTRRRRRPGRSRAPARGRPARAVGRTTSCQVERLARAALASSGAHAPKPDLMLGEALHELGAYEEAESVFARCASRRCRSTDPLFVLIVGDARAEPDVGTAPPRRRARRRTATRTQPLSIRTHARGARGCGKPRC